MIIRSIAVFIFLAAVNCRQSSTAPQLDPSAFKALGEVVMVNRLETKFPTARRFGEGGGMNLELMFSENYYPELLRCRGQVRRLADEWAAEYKMAFLNQTERDNTVILHYGVRQPPGFFEVTYQIYPKEGAAHGYFGFYDQRMAPVDPQLVTTLTRQFKLDAFVKALQLVMQCKQGQAL